jgi:DNA-binding CsgD family transcriptional regulator
VYITDFKGNIIQSFSHTEGLQNDNVLSIFLDNQHNLWLGLDNGIDLVAYNSALKQINPSSQDGSGYTAVIQNNNLYIGTSNGLYHVLLQTMTDLSFSKGNFTMVENTKGQTWGLAAINNQLLMGHHEGAFIIDNNVAKQISSSPGFWNFVSMPGDSTAIVAGNYKGLSLFTFKNGKFNQQPEVNGFSESSRFVAIDKNNSIWVSHPYHGVYKIDKNPDGTYKTRSYSDKEGLPSILNNNVYKIKGEVVIATEKGIFTYNRQKDNFEQDTFYKKLLGTQSIRYLKEDASGNLWFVHEKTVGVIDFSDGKVAVIYLPELNNKLLSGFEFIYSVNENNIFLGGEKGFFHLNYQKYKQTVQALQVQLRVVRIIDKSDSLLFGGYFKKVNEPQFQDAGQIVSVQHHWKTIHFEFSTALFGYQSSLEYSYRLKGFDENWSDWTRRTEKEYTNLPAGEFAFEIKVRNNLGKESPTTTYTFKMLPPWYQSAWAIIVYLLMFSAGLYAVYLWQAKKFKQQQLKYEEEQQKLQYVHQLEINKTESELVALNNEKLEAEINFKNSELASSAMHLVKKGELLAKIKTELTQAMKGLDNSIAVADLKKLIKTLSEDDNMDKDWEHFSKHFDKVHSDFLIQIKEIHPTITPNELKLCAYLRMNLSTKEIAQLLNISVRGVEISRYRLRKKLRIPTEASLFNYLINIQKNNQ